MARKKKTVSRKRNSESGWATIRVMNPAEPDVVNACTTGCRLPNPGPDPAASSSSAPLSTPLSTHEQFLLSERLAQGIGTRQTDPAPAREPNPSQRYITVPVSRTKTGPNDKAVIVRGSARGDAIRDVAQSVDADDWIDVGLTRNHETKKAAQAHAQSVAPRFEMLAERLSRGIDG